MIYGSGSTPAAVAIEKDGQYTWRSDRDNLAGTLQTSRDGRVLFEPSAGQPGPLTLYEGHGRRWMAMDSDGAAWKGELGPPE